VRIDRRTLLIGSGIAGSALAAVGPRDVVAAATRPAVVDGFPMPPAGDVLPAPLPVVDPGRIRFERGWLFHEGDIVAPPPQGHHETYLSVKAGNARGAAAIDYDDGDWQAVELPHDWASFQPFVESANVSQGYRPRGIGWYRRRFRLSEEDRGKRLEIHFDGIATHATVWINGNVAARSWSGYSAVIVDLTPFADFGPGGNVVAVRVDATVIEGWWYEGAGPYRHVWMVKRAPVSIATDGVHADPVRDADGGWRVPVSVEIDNIEDMAVSARVEAVLCDAAGRVLASGGGDVVAPSLARGTASFAIPVADPALWSVDRPVLHDLKVRLIRNGAEVDRRRLAIGFRTIRFDPDHGLFVNDRPVKLKGVCLHQDHAGVGVAVPDALIEWRLGRLKAMGCNAIRSSHNAPNAELLDLADRMGFLVMNENRIFNPGPDHMAQLEWLVRRDRNHPAIVLWSVFNEEPMQGTHAGVEMVRRMEAAVKRLDSNRPVTAAMNGAFYDPVNVSQVVDVMGFNYYQEHYDRFHAANPRLPITSSEDTSAYQTRGAFATDEAAHVHTSYDDESAGWGATHRESWRRIAARPFVAGGFVWTGFDYHGEPTPHAWPTIASFFGILDLCGFPKTAFDIHRAHWVDDRPVVSIAPHWTWPGRTGQRVRVFTMANADRVRLILNGRVIGEQPVDRIMGQEWTVPYAPGRIEVQALRGGQVVARAAHETAGPPVALRLTPARTRMRGDGEDAQPVTIDAVDAAGRHVPTANLATRLAVEGGRIVGLGNGDPNSHESEKGDARSLFNGLAQLIVKADVGAGPVRIRAEAAGMRPASLVIRRVAAPVPAQIPVMADEMTIAAWRRSPSFATVPAATLVPADGDNNSWELVRSGSATPPAPAASWRIYRAVVRPRRRIAAAGGTIAFDAVAGQATLWIDGHRVAEKRNPAPGAMSAPIPSGAGPVAVVLVVEAEPGRPSGIIAAVSIGGT
jgi:beta-galactosidase